jgi:hypothetical protein
LDLSNTELQLPPRAERATRDSEGVADDPARLCAAARKLCETFTIAIGRLAGTVAAEADLIRAAENGRPC